VDRAQARAGEHREDGLGDHRHVDHHGVALADAQLGQRVGDLVDLALEVGIGDRAGVALVALEVDRDAVAVAGLDVAVDAVVGDIELAADEPLGERSLAPVQRGVEVLGPGEVLPALLGPETLVVGLGRGIHRPAVPLACAVNAGSGSKVARSRWVLRLSSVTAGLLIVEWLAPSQPCAAAGGKANPEVCRERAPTCAERTSPSGQ
jgi:hypothetical protein